MKSCTSLDRLQSGHRERGIATAGLPGSSGRSQTGSEEPVTAALASVQKEITVLQQATETLRELAHIQKATNHRLTNATDAVQRLAPGHNGPPAQLDLTGSQPGRPADEGRRVIAEPLTRTEEAVLRRLATTLSLLEIGRGRNVSRDTIKGQVRSIYRKLGVSDRHAAVQRGRELGLLTRRKRLGPVS
jgi:ATP/maltotriose-dependent transcriptional regulator MalT